MRSAGLVYGLMFLASGMVLLALPPSAWADDIHVPGQYANIQAAIDAAQPGDTVIVADGVHAGDGNHDIGFDGKAITVRSANGPQTCVLNGEGCSAGFFLSGDEGPASVIEGFAIVNFGSG